jgi:signal peptidase II
MPGWPSRIRAWGLGLLVLGVDQVTKQLAVAGLTVGRPVELLGSVLRLGLRRNTAAAFSISWGGPEFLLVFSAAAAVVVAVVIWRCRSCTPLSLMALGAIMGGAAGNAADRMLHGWVIDFIDVGAGGWRWPTFNVADIGISVGGILLVILHGSRPGSRRKGGEATDGAKT